MMAIHLSHAAGVTRLLNQCGIEVRHARANAMGIQLLIEQPLPELLEQWVEQHTQSGNFLMGVWVKEVNHDNP